MTAPTSPARADATEKDGVLFVRISGDWRITAPHPDWSETAGKAQPQRVRLEAGQLGTWDSSLALFVSAAHAWAAKHSVPVENVGLPPGLERLAGLLTRKPRKMEGDHEVVPNLFKAVGIATVALWREIIGMARLLGECAYSIGRFFRGAALFRWRDCLVEMQQCGAQALPIVGLISFLVGVTMAYTGAIVLRQYGGDIWLADMVGLAVVREMGPMMAAIVLAGRTGAAFAATLGNMKANEEIDALETLGISPVDFLVMPRIVALCAMMPLLAIYSNLCGIAGGLMVAAGILDIPSSLYWAETKTIVDLSDINTGLIKAFTYGALIALSGCLRGLQADRSAAGVGTAATRAVVTGILLVIISDAVYAVIFNVLNW